MSTRGVSSLDPQQELRAAVAGVQGELSRLQDVGGLLASWLTLVKVLNLNPAPQLRNCPACGNLGMRTASRCGYCWTKLETPADAGA